MFPNKVTDKQEGIIKYLELLGIDKNDITDHNLMLQSFVHKSFSADHNNIIVHNERLEFLGDGILGAIINKILFESHPDMSESQMTLYKIAMVREELLAEVARDIELGKYIFISKGEEKSEGRNKDSILSDCLEAIIAYIYLDIGRDAIQIFIYKYIYVKYERISQKSGKSSKTLLQEMVQKKYKTIPEYVDLAEDTDKKGNVLIYKSEIYILDQRESEGFGTNKKKAQSDAARNLLKKRKASEETKK